MDSSDVSAVRITATGTAYASRTRLRGIFAVGTVAGTIVLRNGSGSGATLLTIDYPIGSPNILIPGNGILFPDGIHATVTGTLTGANLFIG